MVAYLYRCVSERGQVIVAYLYRCCVSGRGQVIVAYLYRCCVGGRGQVMYTLCVDVTGITRN
ncbi:hypothetical protein DPMN_137541 [Dreissena polymorpha]|uniref:Uncharacterized protein n=1 Tax=Dreissena polymorpha TaxID=45954 RepID=A0A9D4JET1_DREPO|nr:hypothetical protein DPMN_137541 [Dreissena polymorpha]